MNVEPLVLAWGGVGALTDQRPTTPAPNEMNKRPKYYEFKL